jgi:hypothetical protein
MLSEYSSNPINIETRSHPNLLMNFVIKRRDTLIKIALRASSWTPVGMLGFFLETLL